MGSAIKVVREGETRWKCANCREDFYDTRQSARDCCGYCERLLPHPTEPGNAVRCPNPRTWSAPMRGPYSNAFPLGFCDLHKPEGV